MYLLKMTSKYIRLKEYFTIFSLQFKFQMDFINS